MRVWLFTIITLWALVTGLPLWVGAQHPPLTVKDWERLLQRGTVEDKIRAAQALADMQAVESVPALGKALEDPEPKVRFYVIRALGALRDPEAEPFLGQALLDPVGDNRREAYRYIHLYYLGIPEPSPLRRLLGSFFREPHTAQVPWKVVHPTVVRALKEWLQSEDLQWVKMAIAASEALWIYDLTSDMAQLLTRPQPKDLVLAVFSALGKLRSCSVLQTLVDWLQAEDPDVLQQAVWALAQCHEAIPMLGERLWEAYQQTPDDERRQRYFQGLAYIGYRPAASIFLTGLTSPAAKVRRFAAEGLGRLGEVQYTEDVGRAFLQEEDASARLAMDFALFRLGRRDHVVRFIHVLRRGSGELRRQLAAYVAEYPNLILSEMFRYFDQMDRDTQLRLLQLAAHGVDPAVIALLEPYLESPVHEIALTAFDSVKIIRQALRLRQAQERSKETEPTDHETP